MLRADREKEEILMKDMCEVRNIYRKPNCPEHHVEAQVWNNHIMWTISKIQGRKSKSSLHVEAQTLNNPIMHVTAQTYFPGAVSKREAKQRRFCLWKPAREKSMIFFCFLYGIWRGKSGKNRTNEHQSIVTHCRAYEKITELSQETGN